MCNAKDKPFIRVPLDKIQIPGKISVFVLKVKRKLKGMVKK